VVIVRLSAISATLAAATPTLNTAAKIVDELSSRLPMFASTLSAAAVLSLIA